MRTVLALLGSVLLGSVHGMAGTNANALRKPIVHRGIAGSSPSAVKVPPSMEECVAAARQSRRVIEGRKLFVKKAREAGASPAASARLESCLGAAHESSDRAECELEWMGTVANDEAGWAS